ncbi:PREDICTED: presenilin-like protein At2g29900 [Tarenaya hassleriana]|uniref:presenilin-like protein At2g29900 n=1 Tax=Tarenaya hassleriana TaxID=28532 RepID=UPI00053C9173|nr:PREDICTED: presenilin-like protein At2g29900 [Tarenaya hassleriana]XP_010547746.1 PREDICTED: presenilin-like protein At2g29900 [Tarenaya hassleriana]XP_010547748.1 PREDICTED: presenilin-like protein At2g29900 [Tarenaya hassleriana]
MDQNRRPVSILESLGEEIIRIVTPVSICMFMVVLLVRVLNSEPSSSVASFSSIATAAYAESDSDSSWDKLVGALLNSLVFVAIVTVATFILVLLFYFRCIRFLKFYMGFSSFIVLGFLGGEMLVFLIERFRIRIDWVTFLIVLINFAVVGVLAVFMSKFSIFVTQGYLVSIGVLVAYFFTLLPEWTTWVLLVALALYDIAAVLLPVGPLRLLVEMVITRDEDIPALVYEARPVIREESGLAQRRVWREQITQRENHGETANQGGVDTSVVGGNANLDDARSVGAEEGMVPVESSRLSVQLIDHGARNSGQVENFLEGIGLGSSGAIKLGLGDFIFYSVLVGRAAMYDLMMVYACYLAIIAGLGITLLLLAVYQKALPALPVSVMLGVLAYFLTRLLLEEFILQCSSNLVMF